MRKFPSSLESQRNRLLERLRQAPATTLQIRHELDILGVAPRIFELRHWYGYNIQTFWEKDQNPGGGKHLVARYVLLPGKYKKGGVREAA